MAHKDVIQDCKVFVSRKPCALCTKLLVQSNVKKVFYLPVEPEFYMDEDASAGSASVPKEKRKKDEDEREAKFKNETSCVDNLFKVSAIGQSVLVPRVEGEVLANTVGKHQTQEATKVEKRKDELFKLHWNREWMANVKDNLPWPAFDDNIKTQVENDFEDMMKWMATILVRSELEEGDGKFQRPPVSSEHEAEGKSPPVSSEHDEKGKSPPLKETENIVFNPEQVEKDFDRQQGIHLLTLAHFLAERTDDPRTGVGAVIMNKKRQIIGLGWNGFPTKALYGEFPRASDEDKSVQDKKYPYIIHAEQNALLNRNTENIEDGVLFVTKTPCDECSPILEMEEIKTVVLSVKMQNESKESLNYRKFYKSVEKGVFNCFQVEK